MCPVGTAVSAGDPIYASKMNLKLETIDNDDLDHAVATTAKYVFGVDAAGQDVEIFGDTTLVKIYWDSSDDQLEFSDNAKLSFGNAADTVLKWDGTNLVLLPLTYDTGAFHIGNGTLSFDLKWFSSAAAKYALFDTVLEKLILEDINLRLGDNDSIEFGDAGDVTMMWDASKLLITPAAEFDISMAVGHFLLKTTLDNKQIRINSRDYTQVSGDTMAFQAKPAQAATTTGDVFGAQLSPRIKEGFGAGSLQGLGINCDLKGAAGGDITTLRGLSVELESASGSTRTVTDAMVIRGRNYLHGIVTNGPYMVQVDAAEGNVEWEAFAKLCDNGGAIADLATAVTGNPTGVLKVKIGSTVGYIPMYAAYTPA